MISAFGVEHGDQVAKFDYGNKQKPSAGRRVLASTPYANVVHPLVAGKKGKKGRAFGNQAGGAVLGGVAGSVAGGAAGALTRNPKAAAGLSSAGALGGMVAGTQGGLARNTRKGYLKRES